MYFLARLIPGRGNADTRRELAGHLPRGTVIPLGWGGCSLLSLSVCVCLCFVLHGRPKGHSQKSSRVLDDERMQTGRSSKPQPDEMEPARLYGGEGGSSREKNDSITTLLTWHWNISIRDAPLAPRRGESWRVHQR